MAGLAGGAGDGELAQQRRKVRFVDKFSAIGRRAPSQDAPALLSKVWLEALDAERIDRHSARHGPAVFRRIFEVTHHQAHYEMMMGPEALAASGLAGTVAVAPAVQ